MARCACGNQTCSCIIQADPDSGISVVGNGSPTRPYLIGQDSGSNPLNNLRVSDSPTVDLSLTPQGGTSPVYNLQADAVMSMSELTDVQDAPAAANGQVMVWRTDHWAYETPASGSPPSGVWGTAPLTTAIYGTNSLMGREVYVDSAGQLRSKPDLLPQSVGKAVTDTPLTYPLGTSVMTLTASQGATWPSAGSSIVVSNSRHETAGGFAGVAQWCHLNSGLASKVWYRSGSNSTWSPWVLVVDSGTNGWISDATGLFTPNATNFTLVSFAAKVSNGIAHFLVRGTSKVTTAAPNAAGDISDFPVGTLSGALLPGAGVPPSAFTTAHYGRGLFAYLNAGTLQISNISGTTAIATGEGLSLSGMYFTT
jgi:hypothetical protein